MEGQPKEVREEQFAGRQIRVSLRAGAVGNRLAEAQQLLPFGYNGVYGESLEGFGRAKEGKVPSYFEATFPVGYSAASVWQTLSLGASANAR